MSAKRKAVDFLIKVCSFRRLHQSRTQKLLRSFLDEIDLQHLRDSQPCRGFADRLQMFEHLQAERIKGDAIDYLEFGVYRGESIQKWSSINQQKESRFFGFDSFEGLPDGWRPGQGRGHFDVDGNLPEIDDERVHFIKGWFDATIPPFVRSFTQKNRLVMHLDADLYGSTMLPLLYFRPLMNRGTILIFDEFYDRDHEFKAFQDWLRVFKVDFRVVAEVCNFAKIAVELD